jgi:hypothetical protein
MGSSVKGRRFTEPWSTLIEGIVAKHLADAYHPKLARWHKILNRTYSRRGRAEWFERQGRYARGHGARSKATNPLNPL